MCLEFPEMVRTLLGKRILNFFAPPPPDICAEKIPLVLMGGQACADPGAIEGYLATKYCVNLLKSWLDLRSIISFAMSAKSLQSGGNPAELTLTIF
jgi:hypothetical protein